MLAAAGFDVTFGVPHDCADVVDKVRIEPIARPSGRVMRMAVATIRLARLARSLRPSIVHFHDPELIPVGLFLKGLGVRVIYDVHEDLPKQIRSKHWINPWLRPVLATGSAAVEAIAARILDGIIVATPAIARRFPTDKTETVQNFPFHSELALPSALPYRERSPTAAYVGGISEIRGIREMLAAMDRLPDRLGGRLKIAGSFTPVSLEREMLAVPGWSRVDYVGWQSRADLALLMGSVRMGLVLFHPVPNHVEAQPNKLFEYMSAGVPVVASDFPLWREIVEGAGCGLLVDPLDPDAIAGAIAWLLDHPEEAERMGQAGRQSVLTRYNWESESRKLVDFYNRILS
ncbi:MAG TPA: glycosyltransferase family 4 protein [Nitrospira sp.]|nr:glycosyltransferase family 4 protein [Nitrospira sp.]